jgi:hypothetical protein
MEKDSRENWHQDSQMWRRKRVEWSGTRMRRYGGGKEIVGRSWNRMPRCRRGSREKWHQDAQMWRRKIVGRSGTRMRRRGGGKDQREVAPLCADGVEIAERSGTSMRRFGGGKEIVGRSGNRMRRWRRVSREKWHLNAQMWRRKRVERSAPGCVDVEEEKR